MTEPDLEQLIKNWYQREGENLPTISPAECPPLTFLWRHLVQGAPLEAFEEHVSRCQRCRRLIEIIKRERDRAPTTAPPTGRSRRVFSRVGGALAAAACIGFLFLNWPGPSFDAPVSVFGDRVLGEGATTTYRGDDNGGTEPASPAKEAPGLSWLTETLADPDLAEPLGTIVAQTIRILGERLDGNIRIDRAGRISLADGLDESVAFRVTDLIETDSNACDQIVSILIRHISGAKEKDRPAIRRALNRWRAENTFRAGE